MQVWNVLHVAGWKYRTQKWRKKSPSGHHPTTLSGYIFATEACIDNRKKLVKQQYLLHMSPQYGELRHTSGWDRFGSLGHPSYFQWLPRLGSVTARQSSSERQPNYAALNRARHQCSAGRPSRWALAHISSSYWFVRWRQWASEQMITFLCRYRTYSPDDWTDIATMVRRALAEVCAVPVLLVLAVTNEKIVSKMTSITVWAPLWEVQYAFRCALKTGREGAKLRLLASNRKCRHWRWKGVYKFFFTSVLIHRHCEL